MPVPELQKFREKYPDYGDMSDADLATKLAQKYPEDYGDLPGKVQGQSGSSSEMTDAEFTRERQRSATQDPTFQKFARATIPTAAAVASFVPGLQGLGAQMMLGAGGTMLNQMAGMEEPSLYEVGKGAAIPALVVGAGKAVMGGLKAIGKATAPGVTRTAGVEAAMENVDVIPNTVDRAYAPKLSKVLFDKVSKVGGVPAKNVVDALDDAAKRLDSAANPSKVEGVLAGDYIRNVANKFRGTGSADYGDVVEEMQRLRAASEGADNLTAIDLNTARARVLDALDKVSPAVREANAQYRREQAVEKINKVLTNPRPDVKLGELLNKDPLTRGIISYEEAKMFENIGKEIATIGTTASPYSGVGARIMNLLATPVSSLAGSRVGMKVLKNTFGNGPVTLPKLNVAAQFARAYMASGADMEDNGKSTDIGLPIKTAENNTINALKNPEIPLEQKIHAAATRAQVTYDIEKVKQAIKAGAGIGAQVRP